MIRNLLFFAGAIAVSLLAAWWRWPDSAHAMGVLRSGGGKARHAVAFPAGPSSYQLVTTATVLPPWRGDARISVEGEPPVGWTAALSRPAVDLGLHDFPRLEGGVIRGLRPREHIALWLDLHAGEGIDPVCGMSCPLPDPAPRGDGAPGASETRALHEDGRCFCSEACLGRYRATPEAFPAAPRGRYRLSFRDAATNAPLLTVPLVFGAEGGGDHAAHH
jgi:YHS domain-containing protein